MGPLTRPFLITGCGRSGTRYMADFLTCNGVPTGWEAVLRPTHPCNRARDYLFYLRRLHLAGDSNWLAAPYMAKIPASVTVFHQIRNPLNVVRSFLALRFFGDDYVYKHWAGERRHTVLPARHCKGLAQQPTAVERCLCYWVRWNRLVERLVSERELQCFTYQFEQAVQWESGVMETIWEMIHGGIRPVAWNQPGNSNKLLGADAVPFGWDQIPDGPLKDEAMEMADEYGY